MRLAFAVALGLASVTAPAAPVPKELNRAGGVFVLDDCDPLYKGKDAYDDNLTFFTPAGEQKFRLSGFNNCQSIGSTHAVAADPARNCVWVVENVARRVRRFDLAGKETLAIPDVKGSAVAVDPETGNAWVLAGSGAIGQGRVEVYDPKGKLVATHAVSGWDIAYDRKAKAVWIAEKKLTKIDAATGKELFSTDVAAWCSSSLDVDPRTGACWVAVRAHGKGGGQVDRLVKFDADGKEAVSVGLDKTPFRVSVDPKDGGVWVALLYDSAAVYSADGKAVARHELKALAVQADPAGGAAWVVTPTDTRRLTAKGEVTATVKHAAEASMAWIAALE